MEPQVSELEARLALDTIDRGHMSVVEEIGLPRWYLYGLAVCWIALGIVADLGTGWVTAVATLVFAAVHGWIAPRVAGGRRRTGRVRVIAEVAGPNTGRIVIGALVALGALTVGVSLAARADGARHPTTVAALLVATIVVLGGPHLFAGVRARARRTRVPR